MTSVLAILVLGFVLGMRHATDPDHVIAVSTIVARQKSPAGATAIGAVWGLGHTITIMVVGGGIILFGWVIPPRIGLSMEFSVGMMLILLGVLNLGGVLGRMGEARPHAAAHHPHAPDATPLGWLDRTLGGLRGYQLARPLVVGIVHGLAGSAAVALLVLTTIQKPAWAIAYLLIFGVGTIVGMMVMTAMLVLPFRRRTLGATQLGRRLRFASGVISLAFGLFIAWRIGITDGLFSGHPHWTPE